MIFSKKKFFYLKFFNLILIGIVGNIKAQELTIQDIQVNKDQKRVMVELKNEDRVDIGEYSIKGFETINGKEEEVEDLRIQKKSQPTVILYLLDESGSMAGGKIKQATTALEKIVNDQGELSNSTLLFAGFHNDVKWSQSLSKRNIGNITEKTRSEVRRGLDTDLYYAMISKIEELEEDASYQNYNKVIILITDGYNDIDRNPNYRDGNRSKRYSRSDVFDKITKLDSSFHICVAGVGDASSNSQQQGLDIDFARSLPDKTPSYKDIFVHAEDVDDLQRTIEDISALFLNTFEVSYYPRTTTYIGQNRQLHLEYTHGTTDREVEEIYSAGASGTGFSIARAEDRDYGFLFMIGLAIILGLLLLFVILGPLIDIQLFKWKYVKTYAAYKKKYGKEKQKHKDPRLGVELENSDEVVDKCEHVQLWSSWKAEGHRCNRHDICIEGKGIDNKQFFSQKGSHLILNWIWFGVIGGFLGWLLFVGFNTIGLDFESGLKPVFGTKSGAFHEQMRISLAIGAGLTLALSWVEEIGQSRKFNFGRIIFRTLIAALMAMGAFIVGELAYQYVYNQEFVGRLLAWIIFGTLTGMSLTLNSSIKFIRGIKGGFIAAIGGFIGFWTIQQLFPIEWGNMVGYMVYGGLLGGILRTYVAKEEEYSLEVLYPNKRRGQIVAISRWLEVKEEIIIGAHPKSDVYIKWIDKEISENHVFLSLKGKQVELKSNEDIKINGKPLKNSSAILQHDDIIQLSSTTTYRFVAKEKESIVVKKVQTGTKSKIVIKQVHKKETTNTTTTRPRIVIRRKNDQE